MFELVARMIHPHIVYVYVSTMSMLSVIAHIFHVFLFVRW